MKIVINRNPNENVVPHLQLQEVVLERIRTAIFNNKFKPDEWIRQKTIAEEMGVSQMPVREALKELAKEGLIEHVPYRGMRLMRFSPDDIDDLFAQRACLESRAARVVATIITDEQIIVLKNLQTEMEANVAPDQIVKYRQLNRDFHQAIYQLCSRNYLVRTLDQMWKIFPSMLFGHYSETFRHPLTIRDETDIIEHQAIITALEKRNPEDAEQAVRTHIENTCRDLLSKIKSKS